MNVRFTATGNFVTAEVMRLGSKTPFLRTDLTLPQFNELLVGSEGQYDNVLENSIPAIVRQVATTDGKQIEQQAPDPLQAQSALPPAKPFQRVGIARLDQLRAQQVAPAGSPPKPYQPPSELKAPQAQQPRAWRVDDDATGYSPQLEARANAIFGKGNIGNEAARQRWMAEQEQRAIENEINRSKALVYPVGGR